jgi:hypothetical protein
LNGRNWRANWWGIFSRERRSYGKHNEGVPAGAATLRAQPDDDGIDARCDDGGLETEVKGLPERVNGEERWTGFGIRLSAELKRGAGEFYR